MKSRKRNTKTEGKREATGQKSGKHEDRRMSTGDTGRNRNRRTEEAKRKNSDWNRRRLSNKCNMRTHMKSGKTDNDRRKLKSDR